MAFSYDLGISFLRDLSTSFFWRLHQGTKSPGGEKPGRTRLVRFTRNEWRRKEILRNHHFLGSDKRNKDMLGFFWYFLLTIFHYYVVSMKGFVKVCLEAFLLWHHCPSAEI